MPIDVRLYTLTVLISLPLILASSLGSLSLSHALSQQFPPVARVSQPFTWTFSANTFGSPDDSALSYTAFNLPSWLAFSGASRTFTGQPTSDDIGSRIVQITATTPDGQSSISDYVALAVSEKKGQVTLSHPVASQIDDPDSGSITSAFPYSSASSHYPGVRVPPNWSFSLGFTPSTFTAATRVFYSASLDDGSPLPAWLSFNNQTVTFDGVTPSLPSGTAYEVILSGSDVFGYADIQEKFNIVIAAHDLQVAQQPVINMTLGLPNDAGLRNVIRQSLISDGQQGEMDMSHIKAINLDTSSLSWLAYSAANVSLSGTPPTTQSSTSLPLCVLDNYGDAINTTLQLVFYPSLFAVDKPDPVRAETGQPISLPLNKYFANGNTPDPVNLSVTLDPKDVASWLALSGDEQVLSGTAPNDVNYDQVTVNLRAQDLVTNAWSRSTLVLALQSNGTALPHVHNQSHMNGLMKGTKVAIGIVCALVVILVLLFALMAIRRRRANSARRAMIEDPREHEGKWSYEAAETPAMEYTEKMGDPATAQMLVLGRVDGAGDSTTTVVGGVPAHLRGATTSTVTSKLKKSYLSNPFARANKRILPKISSPIIMPSFSNAAFQAQLAAAVDSAGIVKRDTTMYSTHSGSGDDHSADFTATPSYVSGSQVDRSQAGSKASQRSDMTGGSGEYGARTTITDDSAFAGQSSRASWESEPPFVWTVADTPGNKDESIRTHSSPSSQTHDTASTSHHQHDPYAPTQRADFKVTSIPMPSSRAPSPHDSTITADLTDEDISIDNIHFPTDSDLAHTETSSILGDDPNAGAVIQTASRVDARRTLDSPATASLASSHTERGAPSPVMTTHSRLVSFGKQRTIEVEQGKNSASQSAVVEAGSIGLGIGSGVSAGSEMNTPPTKRGGQHVTSATPVSQPPRAVTRPRAPLPPSRSPTPPSTLPSLPALPTMPSTSSTSSSKRRTRAKSPLASPQRILLGVQEPFHFYPPLTISPSTSTTSTSSASTTGRRQRSTGANQFVALVEKKSISEKRSTIELGDLPSWLHFEDGELWGVPTELDRGEVDLRIVERRAGEEDRVVGRFALEVVGR
ncbi:hypothetical protein IAU60_006082 [Kwoniella sp. DSM 27419]